MATKCQHSALRQTDLCARDELPRFGSVAARGLPTCSRQHAAGSTASQASNCGYSALRTSTIDCFHDTIRTPEMQPTGPTVMPRINGFVRITRGKNGAGVEQDVAPGSELDRCMEADLKWFKNNPGQRFRVRKPHSCEIGRQPKAGDWTLIRKLDEGALGLLHLRDVAPPTDDAAALAAWCEAALLDAIMRHEDKLRANLGHRLPLFVNL